MGDAVTRASVVGARGGWAAIVSAGTVVRELVGWEAGATQARLELLTAVAGLGALPAPGQGELVTRSQRLHQALMTDQLATWERAGWRTARAAAEQRRSVARAGPVGGGADGDL